MHFVTGVHLPKRKSRNHWPRSLPNNPGGVAITTFSSNVARIKAVADAAAASGRQFIVAGRALHRVISVAMDVGYLPKDFSYLDQEHFGYFAPNEVLALVTGSQGESRAAMARISAGEHRDIKLGQGDSVIYSSRVIPGNEKAILAIQNRLAGLGCKIITDNEGLVHVTGHPRRDELRQMFDWTKPRVMVPHARRNASPEGECTIGARSRGSGRCGDRQR